MVGGRSLALMLVAVVMALAGVTAGYVNVELAEPDAFADRSLDALRSDAVKSVIAEQIVVALLERRSPDLVATRPLVITAVEAVVDTRQFSRVMRRGVVIAHGVLVRRQDKGHGLAGCLRVSVGTPEENDRFLAAAAQLR